MSVRMLVTECFDGNHTECKGYNGPANNPNFVCDCDCHRKQIHDDPICPCHEFSARTPSEASSSAKIPREPENVKTAPTPVYGAAMTISIPTFEQEWQDAPRWVTNYTEQQVAEYWFIRGQHAKEVELVTLLNLDLTEMVRVARERAIR